jgi:transcriptional regulator with XRE-family HTH domain
MYKFAHGKIKSIRKEKKLKLKNVAQLTGLSAAIISKIENGTSSPRFETMIKIATALCVHPSVFIEREAVEPVTETEPVEGIEVNPYE